MSRNAASLLVCIVALCAASTRVEAAGGAFGVDDAQIAPINTCQVESWVSSARNRDFVGATAPACTVDIFRPIEFKTEFQRLRAGGVWASGIGLQAKTVFYPAEPGKIGLAMSGSTAFDLTTNQYAGAFLNIPATYMLNERLRFHLNAGWLHSQPADAHFVFWGAAVEWTITQPLVLLAEVFGQAGPAPRDLPSLNDPRAQVGLRYTPVEAVDLDLIWGRNITGVRTDWITVGLTMRFAQ